MSQVKCENLICAWCKNNIYRKQSRLSNSKSGLYFCDRICKENAQQIGGLQEMKLEHYKDGASTYSSRAFRYYGVK